MKNVLGVLAARARAARRAADDILAPKLAELERELGELFDGWARYLRSTQLERPTVEPIEVGAWLAELVAATEVAAAAAEVEVTVELAGAVPVLHGDRRLLGEAVGNLIDNAIAAGAGHRAHVVVRAREAEGGLAIDVADDGPGIAAVDLPRVLAPGYTTKPTGSGLGLPLAERIVAAHRGRLLVRSEPGAGTTVTLALPTDGVGVRWRRSR
ncbi:MAG: ATP-binding protein [Kofleriaceae bacterium]